MARKSDGTVYIDTKIDASGFGKGVSSIGQKLSKIQSAFGKFGTTIKNTFSQSNTANLGKSYEQLQQEIAKTEIQLDRLIEKQIKFVETGGNRKSRAFAGMEYDIQMARDRLEELHKQLSFTSKETPKKVNKMRKWIDRLKKSFDSLGKSSKKSHHGILRMLGTSILFSTVFRVISAVTNGFGEGINNLALYSDNANKTMSALKSSLTQLKNSFATAFMPIITAVTPLLTQFMSLVSKATGVVAAFFSALTGNKTYIKAIEVQEDYASSLDKTAESAKKAQKYLSGLDEIRTFTQKESDSNNAVVLPENMFKEEEIDSTIIDFSDKVRAVINKIKDFIKNEDWEGLGGYISDGIFNALNFLSKKIDEIDWKGIGNKIGQFLKGLDWISILSGLGDLIWQAIKAAIELWTGSFEEAPIETILITSMAFFTFTGLGKFLAKKIITSIITSLTSKSLWAGIFTGKNIFIPGTPAFDVIGNKILSFIENSIDKLLPNWAKKLIGNIVAGISLGGIAGSFVPGAGTLIGAIAGAITGAITSFDFSELGALIIEKLFNFDETLYFASISGKWFLKIKEDFKNKDWLLIGKDILMGILNGLGAAITAPVEIFKDLFSWAYEGICDVFGIHSPSTEMEPIGKNIILGITNGMSNSFEEFTKTISDFFNNYIKPWLTKEKWINAMNGIEEAFESTWTGAVNSAISILNKFIDEINEKMHFEWEAFKDPIFGNELFGAGSVQLFTIPKIPYLATGAVIPPNAPFMAVLGDQRHGNNLEMPEDLLRKVVREESGYGRSGSYQFTAQINRRTLFEEMIEEAKMRQLVDGRNPFDLA